MFYSCDYTESDIIVELTINSSTEICDNRDINGDLKGWSPFNMHLNATRCCICMQHFVELIPWHTQRDMTAWYSAEMIQEMI